MTCKKTRKMIPLLYGGEIGESMRARVQSHLDSCRTCRKEYRSLMDTADTMKQWLNETPVEWEGSQWIGVVQNAAEKVRGTGRSQWIPRSGRSWGWAAAVLLLAGLGLSYFFVFQPVLNPGIPVKSSLAKSEPQQEVVSMTFISKKTGLKINWFLNKNFHWEEKK